MMLNNTNLKEIVHIDCTKEFDSNSYFEIGKTSVVTTEFGTYRETDGRPLSRFGYRFKLTNKQKPHLLVVRYPDDKNRFMCISDGSMYDLDTGIMCGGINPVSNSMLEVKNYFFPRWTDETIVFTGWGYDAPAAVSEFYIYELDALPENELPSECKGHENRHFGIQYEDPCNVCAALGAQSLDEFIDRHIDYMKFTAQDTLTYPICWYHGPIVPSDVQPYSRFILSLAEDRKRYRVTKFDTADWLDYWLKRFDEEGFSFTGSLTLMRLGRLMENMNVDIDSIKNGSDTYNNIRFDGNVQKSTNDWTVEYNPLCFESVVRARKSGSTPKYAYNETPTPNDIAAPIFNPLHPTVQNQVIELLSELAAKYKKHPSFKGLSINFWHGTMLWYGNLLTGYDDYSIGLFEKETGIDLGIDIADSDRFRKRYTMIMTNLKELFVQWRCKKIYEFIIKCRDAVRAQRADLTLTLNIWNEPSMLGYLNCEPDSRTAFGIRKSNYEQYREGGLDIALFADDDGIGISVENNHLRDNSKNYEKGDIHTKMYTDFAFLDKKTQNALNNVSHSKGFIFNSWVEMWGTPLIYDCSPDDKNLETISVIAGEKADSVYEENSIYKDDPDNKFWFEPQLRITSAFPSGYYMEWLANEVAVHDATELTSGGLYLDTAHADEQRKFATEYRKLPNAKFHTLHSNCASVVVRWLLSDGKTYIYAVNREPYDTEVTVKTKRGNVTFELGAFELETKIFDGENIPKSYDIKIPSGVCEKYSDAVLETIRAIEKCDLFIPGAQKMKDDLTVALKTGDYPFIRHALKSHIIDMVKKQ